MPSCKLGQIQRDRGNPNNLCLAGIDKLVVDVSFNSTANTSDMPHCRLECHSSRSSSFGSSKAWLGFPSTYVVRSCLLSLQHLSLTDVDFSDSALGADILSGSSFPFLKKLKMEQCRGMTALKIYCPNLEDILVCRMDLYSMHISGMRLDNLYSHPRLGQHFCAESTILDFGAMTLLRVVPSTTLLWRPNYLT